MGQQGSLRQRSVGSFRLWSERYRYVGSSDAEVSEVMGNRKTVGSETMEQQRGRGQCGSEAKMEVSKAMGSMDP